MTWWKRQIIVRVVYGWSVARSAAGLSHKMIASCIHRHIASVGYIEHSALWRICTRDIDLICLTFMRGQICITSSLESTSRFIPSASPVLSRFTSSSTYQPISLITTTLIIHHSFILSLQAENLPFRQILSTFRLLYLPDYLMITELDRTYHAHHFIFSFTFLIFCLFHVVD